MSTDLHDRPTKPLDEGPDKPEKPKPALSFTQVVGGALAAMTAAALGSRLSVAGTLVGAALASVVAAVAGSVYTSSLRRTSQHVTRVITSRSRAGVQRPGGASTTDGSPVAPVWDSPAEAEGDGPVTRVDQQPAPATTTPDDEAPRRLGWKPVVVGAVLIFAIAAVALTGLELATGRALSGGTGTTVGQVAEGRTDPTPSAKPSVTPSGTATPTPTPVVEPTPSASPTASSEPSATPSTSATAAPSASPAPSATADPSVSVSPGLAPAG